LVKHRKHRSIDARVLGTPHSTFEIAVKLKNPRQVMTPSENTAPRSSPYTFRDIDAAITHLEHILSGEGATSLFSKTYWRGRVLQASATSGLAPNQNNDCTGCWNALMRREANGLEVLGSGSTQKSCVSWERI
jgi:hypothetical protein